MTSSWHSWKNKSLIWLTWLSRKNPTISKKGDIYIRLKWLGFPSCYCPRCFSFLRTITYPFQKNPFKSIFCCWKPFGGRLLHGRNPAITSWGNGSLSTMIYMVWNTSKRWRRPWDFWLPSTSWSFSLVFRCGDLLHQDAQIQLQRWKPMRFPLWSKSRFQDWKSVQYLVDWKTKQLMVGRLVVFSGFLGIFMVVYEIIPM